MKQLKKTETSPVIENNTSLEIENMEFDANCKERVENNYNEGRIFVSEKDLKEELKKGL